jgi:transcriptional regulatory protein LevR
VSEVIRRVNNHITLLDPKNVADQLKGVAASVQKKQTAVINKQADAQVAQKKAKRG